MKRLITVAMIALGIVPAATALTDAECDMRYAACFDFSSLVDGGSTTPRWLEDGGFWFIQAEGETLQVDPETGVMTPYSPPDSGDAEDSQFQPGSPSPNDQWRLIDLEFDLGLVDAQGDTLCLTDDGAEDNAWTTWGALWSPDSRRVAVGRWSTAGVPTSPIIDWLDPEAPSTRETTTQACRPRPVPSLWIIDVEKQDLIPMALDDDWPEPMMMPVGWVPESDELLVIRFDRTMQRQDLLAVDPTSGTTCVLIAERSDTFIDGLAASSLFSRYLVPVGDGEHFIWLNERDGFHHLYLYRYDGSLVRRLTHGDFSVDHVESVDQQGQWIYLSARSDLDDPTSRHLCRVRLDGSGFTQLTHDSGRRRVTFDPDHRYFVENHSDLDRAPSSQLRRSDGKLVVKLAQADTSKLEAWNWQPPSRAVVKAADGLSDCYCAVYLPPEFDPDRRYPVIEVIYAGPQWMIVPRRFTPGEYGDTAAALAQLGYVSVIIDSPGTAGIGKSYQDAVYGRLGQIEIPDHVAAIKNLAADRPWMDLERVGVHGKSWGGYFVLRAMLMAPDFYKVGVASSLVADLSTTSESPVVPYIGLPLENPESYAAADCLPLADRLTGQLLVTIGTSDLNTPFGQSMRMLSALTEADKDVEMLILPGQHHWLQGKSYERWQRAMREFFREHLSVEKR